MEAKTVNPELPGKIHLAAESFIPAQIVKTQFVGKMGLIMPDILRHGLYDIYPVGKSLSPTICRFPGSGDTGEDKMPPIRGIFSSMQRESYPSFLHGTGDFIVAF